MLRINFKYGYFLLIFLLGNVVACNESISNFAVTYSENPQCIPPYPQSVTFVPASLFESIAPSGRLIRPVGRNVFTARFPMNLWASRKYRELVVTTGGIGDMKIQFFDYNLTLTAEVVGGDFFYGITGDPDGGDVVYVSAGGDGEIWAISLDTHSVTGKFKVGGYVAGLSYDRRKGRVFFVRNNDSLPGYVEISGGNVTYGSKGGVYPLDVVVSSVKGRVFISNWGERSISVFDEDTLKLIGSVEVGKNPEGMALSPDERFLYVAASDSDMVYIVNTDSLTVEGMINFRESIFSAGGLSDVALSDDGRYLFYTMARFNYVGVYDLWASKQLGEIPVGYYPTAVLYEDGKIFVTNGKGAGAGPNPHGPHVSTAMRGSITAVDFDLDVMGTYTRMVEENNSFNWRYYNSRCSNLFPPSLTEPEPIKHVVLIVRENKTYDELLGDLEGANGDPTLTLWGEDITPNLHALAREFVNCDNYYSEAENSLQGHAWTALLDSNDFTEKVWLDQFPLVGMDEATIPESGSLFLHLFNYGVDFRNYGEVVGFGFGVFDEELQDYIDFKYPFWNMVIPDLDKVKEVIREMEEGIFPEFVYIVLPNDHTYGGLPGKPAPDYMVAENDYATGYFIDYISHSKYWEDTIIFIIEDDPQSYAGDHVDAHRSICIAVSPWVKRGYVSHVHYDIGSLYRTIELILGIPPLNINDAEAAPMYDIFTDSPDFTPFTRRSMRVKFRLNTWETPMAYESSQLDFSTIDRAPGLGKILWRIMKGDVKPPPYAKGIDY